MSTIELLPPNVLPALPELAEPDAVLSEIDRQTLDTVVEGLEGLDADTVAELEHTRDGKMHSMFESEGVGRPRK